MNFKKIFTGFVSITMFASTLTCMPATAFADETTSRTYTYEGYEVSYDVTNSWENTEVVSITLTNTSDETIENWMMYFNPNGEVQYATNAEQKTTSDGITYFKNSGYNADVAPDSSVTFGYAVKDCEDVPDSFTLCQTRSEKEDGYTVSLQVNQTWGDNDEYFNGEIVIQNNTDEPIEAWELMVDTNFTITEITNSWAASVTELEPYSYLLKGTYTGTVYANSSVSLGFTGVKDGNAEIIDYSLTEVVVDEDVVYIATSIDDDIDWSELPDSDGDGLPDEYESEYGCDANNPDSDGDGLPDGYEILKIGSDPVNAYSLDTVLSDGAYDNDQDGLSNYEEYLFGTDPLLTDSDYDGLSDGDEVNIYETEPLDPDTDGDGLSDGDEIALGLNPLVSDTNGDGVPDNEEKFNQSKTFDADEDDTVIQQIDVAFEGTGYINSTTSVTSVMDIDWMCSNVEGLIGDPYDISSDSTITEGTLTFHVAAEALGESSFDDLIVLWYNEAEQCFEEMETVRDSSNFTLSITTTHFSKYLIVDCGRWYAAWSKNYYPESSISLHAALTIDCSDSMNWNDKQDESGNCYRKTAATGFIDKMDENDMTSLIFFHEDSILVQSLTGDKAILKNTLDSMFSNGYTNYDSALETAYNSLNISNYANSENIIIFISDGVPTDNNGVETDFDVYNNTYIQSAIDHDVRIYTIGLTESADQTVLQDIANVTGGEYFYAASAENLIQYFLTINMEEKYDTTTDTDSDGIPDLFETYGMPVANGKVVLFSDPTLADTDGDGLKDGEEVSVNDDTEEKLAIKANACGGIYFKMNSDPEQIDTDKDFDPDNADPNPLSYQLNGYFAQKMGELQKVAQKCIEVEPSEYLEMHRFMSDIWCCWYYIRIFNPEYRSDPSSSYGGKWALAAGEATDNAFIQNFINEINSNPEYQYLNDYFSSKRYIYADGTGKTADLYHLAAVLTGQIYTTDTKKSFGEDYINALCGWTGDLHQVMNTAYNFTYNSGTYSDIGDALYDRMKKGKENEGFGYVDLYADMDAVNLFDSFNSIFPKSANYYDMSIEDVINGYYSKNITVNEHMLSFVILSGINYQKVFSYTYPKTAYGFNLHFMEYDFSETDREKCSYAFIRFLNDTYGVNSV